MQTCFHTRIVLCLTLCVGLVTTATSQAGQAAHPDGDGSLRITGAQQLWHTLQFDLAGPYASETDTSPNPFTDHRMTLVLTHEDGQRLSIPGYFAADGDAANSSGSSGTVWRALFVPTATGRWHYRVHFHTGVDCALATDTAGEPLPAFDGATGFVDIGESTASGRDLRAHGLLRYVGKRYLQFAGSGEYFLKAGADAPETLLGYADFDNTTAGKPAKVPLKTWEPHLNDWQRGDPTWQGGKGKGLIGAINYLSGKGCNAFSFLTYNAGGDGDNVWPFVDRDDPLHYDCSKLDQWGIVFDHGTRLGMYLHFKMQETENDDTRHGKKKSIPEALDGGDLGRERKLYCRELIARFGHNLALNWNLGEENTQSTEQQRAMLDYIAALDPYDHPRVIHTYPEQQDQVYRPFLGPASQLTGVSLQNSELATTHEQTVKWVTESRKAGKPWIVAFDESGSAAHAQCPDLGYRGFDGHDRQGVYAHTQHDVRKQTLWATLMGGGAGNEYYFGYQFEENDLVCEDWRSRDQSWDYCRIALEFFHENGIPFWDMMPADARTERPNFCLAKPGDLYLIYCPAIGSPSSAPTLDLSDTAGSFEVFWFSPREGGALARGSVMEVAAGRVVNLGRPQGSDDSSAEEDDWLALIRRGSR